MSGTQIFYQETTIENVLATYAKGYKPPGDGVVLKHEANYDPRTGKVWFKLFVEMPAPENNKIITLPG
jgi:hypothetical protein